VTALQQHLKALVSSPPPPVESPLTANENPSPPRRYLHAAALSRAHDAKRASYTVQEPRRRAGVHRDALRRLNAPRLTHWTPFKHRRGCWGSVSLIYRLFSTGSIDETITVSGSRVTSPRRAESGEMEITRGSVSGLEEQVEEMYVPSRETR